MLTRPLIRPLCRPLATSLVVHSAGSFSPLSLAPLMWLDASDAGTMYDATTGGALVAADGAISRWEDRSGNGRHATQATLAARPLKKAATLNGLPVVRFDGVDDSLLHALSVVGDHTIFMVTKSNNVDAATRVYFSASAPNAALNCTIREVNGIWGTYRSGGERSSGQSIRGGYRIISMSAVGSAGTFSHNGAILSFTGSGLYQDASERRVIGGDSVSSAESASCDIAEILVYPLLSAGNRLAVERYLNAKWACY